MAMDDNTRDVLLNLIHRQPNTATTPTSPINYKNGKTTGAHIVDFLTLLFFAALLWKIISYLCSDLARPLIDLPRPLINRPRSIDFFERGERGLERLERFIRETDPRPRKRRPSTTSRSSGRSSATGSSRSRSHKSPAGSTTSRVRSWQDDVQDARYEERPRRRARTPSTSSSDNDDDDTVVNTPAFTVDFSKDSPIRLGWMKPDGGAGFSVFRRQFRKAEKSFQKAEKSWQDGIRDVVEVFDSEGEGEY